MTALLMILLPYALRYTDGGDKRYALHALVALVADVIVAHTTWALIAGWPKRGEWTVSQTLERLCLSFDDRNQLLYAALARYINRQSPTHDHIKAVL